MNVLSVAYPFAQASLNSAGGSEQILALLDRGLVTAGHKSVVIAAEGSRVTGELVSVPVPLEASYDKSAALTHCRWREAIDSVIRQGRVDLVHFHGLDFYQYLPSNGTKALATLHLPPAFYPDSTYAMRRPRTWFNCVSKSQFRACPPTPLMLDPIENGVPLELLSQPVNHPGNYVLAIGRICPEKGFHLAVDAAEKAGVPLYLAGKLFPYPDHIRYWREELEPRLRPPHKFLGLTEMPEKPQLMASARCLLVPSLVAETSSLVTMESLACGTPVVAFPSGALADLVEPERTGFLVRDAEEMARAIALVNKLDRAQCRAVAQSRFSATRMVQQYLSLYARLIEAA